MHRGAVWIVDLGQLYEDETFKRRPVVIVSNDTANVYSETVTILPISGQVDRRYPFEVMLGEEVGLNQPSKAKANQIRTLDQACLVRPIGQLNEAQMMEVERAIRVHLGMESE